MKVYKSKKAKKNILRTYDLLLSQWEIDVEERMVPTRYGDTHVIVCGKEDGIPLLLFHGVGDDSALMWIYNAKALGEHFKLYAIDTIGGPGKSKIGQNYNKDFDDVLWIDELIEKLQLTKVHLAGVSHGGYLVQLYTMMRPEKVEKGICLAAAVPFGENGSPMKTMIKIFLPEALFPTKGNIEKLLRKLSGKNHEVFTNHSLIMEHYRWLLKGFNNRAMKHHKVRNFTIEEVDKIRNKVYYFVGNDDPFQQMGGRQALLQTKMNVEFYDGVGHGINHEISNEINKAMIKIIKEG